MPQHAYTAGKDRYGAYLMIGDFRSAMPSIEVATQLAANPALLEAVGELIDANRSGDRAKRSQATQKARAAIAAARGN